MVTAATASLACRAAAIVVGAVAWIAPSAFAQTGVPPVPSIVTMGEAIVRRAPDRAFVTASVETRARNPQDAQRQNAAGMSAVQAALQKAGIAETAVRTLGYSIQQEVDYVDGRRVLREFLARNALEVRLDDIGRIGEVLGLVVQAGATSVSGIRFDLQDRATVEREALAEAVADARARAEAMAAGAARSLGDILRIEDAVQAPMPPRPMMMERMNAAAADAVDVPVAAGEIEIRASVTLTVALR
jgi:uncharacterized protein YggE